jgi:hypothetical protein
MTQSPKQRAVSAREIAKCKKWAATTIKAWPSSPHPGPSHDQWMAWNNEHGAMLRLACATMMMNKKRLGELAGDFIRDNQMKEFIDRLDHSIAFFTEMAKVIKAARARLELGVAVWVIRGDGKKRSTRSTQLPPNVVPLRPIDPRRRTKRTVAGPVVPEPAA